MIVYRIAKSVERARDLSGFGAYKFGGRWNSKGTAMLYTSMNSSLAFLESLVHYTEADRPPSLYITDVEIKDEELIYFPLDSEYPADWQMHENLETKLLGDKWIVEGKFLGIKVRSAINPSEYNFLLNPWYPRYSELVIIKLVRPILFDPRLLK